MLNRPGAERASRDTGQDGSRRGRGRPARGAGVLSRDKVLRAALALLDEQGLDALSIRGLARRLGVAPMSLYNHIASKDELLDVIYEAVLAETAPQPGPISSWRAGLEQMARLLRDGLRAHPAVMPLFATRPVRSAPLLAVVDELLGALLAAGFSAHQAIYTLDAVFAFTIGHAFTEFGTSPAAAPDLDGSELVAQTGRLRDIGLRNLVRVLADVVPHDYDAEFDHGLDALLDGFEALVRSRGTAV